MVETHWDDIRGAELRYLGQTWRLSGDVAVRNSGELLAVDAREASGVKHRRATLYFDLDDATGSLNPGQVGGELARLERDGDDYVLVVRKGRSRYRYRLQRLKYD